MLVFQPLQISVTIPGKIANHTLPVLKITPEAGDEGVAQVKAEPWDLDALVCRLSLYFCAVLTQLARSPILGCSSIFLTASFEFRS